MPNTAVLRILCTVVKHENSLSLATITKYKANYEEVHISQVFAEKGEIKRAASFLSAVVGTSRDQLMPIGRGMQNMSQSSVDNDFLKTTLNFANIENGVRVVFDCNSVTGTTKMREDVLKALKKDGDLKNAWNLLDVDETTGIVRNECFGGEPCVCGTIHEFRFAH